MKKSFRFQWKIRGKLVLSFSIVMIVLLSALGSITYLTFKDSIKTNEMQVAVQSLKNHALTFDKIYGNLLRQIQSMEIALVKQTQSDDPVELVRQLTKRIKDAPSIESVFVAADNDVVSYASQSEERARLNSALISMGSDKSPLLVIGKDVWLKTSLLGGGHNTLHAYYQLNLNHLWKSVLESNTREQSSLVFIANENELLRSHIQTLSKLDSAAANSISNLPSDQRQLDSIIDGLSYNQNEMLQLNGHYVVASDVEPFGWRMYSVMSEAALFSDLVTLKNRVISATVVTFWISLWIVLIVAYRISKPIIALSAATLDVQNSNYSTPLTLGERYDEIGDLAKRFESMRKDIQKLIFTDVLTGIANRRCLIQSLSDVISASKETGGGFSAVIIDLDHFKSVNDTYGHAAGDEVLKAAACAIQMASRDEDIAARYGGEEFCVLLPETDAFEAAVIAERIRLAVKSVVVPYEGKNLTVTCSLGIADNSSVANLDVSDDEEAINTLLLNADMALYFAKDAGRDRCTVYSANLSQEGKKMKKTG